MNFEDFHVYFVEGAPQLEKVAAFKKTMKAALAARNKFCKEQGGIGAVAADYRMVGLIVEPDKRPVDGWKEKTGKGWCFAPRNSFVPDRKTKVGRSLAKEMESLVVSGPIDLAKELGGEGMHVAYSGGGLRIFQSQAFEEAGKIVLIVPKKPDTPAPEIAGCRHVKLSEYYQLKELAA